MFDPNITAIALLSLIFLAFKKAIIIAVIVEDDCVKNVINTPIKKAVYMLSVLSINRVVLFVKLFSRKIVNVLIPYINKRIKHKIENTNIRSPCYFMIIYNMLYIVVYINYILHILYNYTENYNSYICSL